MKKTSTKINQITIYFSSTVLALFLYYTKPDQADAQAPSSNDPKIHSQVDQNLSDVITSSKYNKMRSEFLNIDADLFFDLTAEKLKQDSKQNFLDYSTRSIPNSIGFKIAGEGSKSKWRNFGANYWCKNEFGETSICRFNTGGMRANKPETICGSKVSADISKAKHQKENFCKKPNSQWREFSVWMGAFEKHNYVADLFPGANKKPLNRLCVEIEYPKSNFLFNVPAFEEKPEYAQLVNPLDAAKSLRHLLFEFGTYTSPYYSADKTTKSAENGGTFHRGGTHYYHKPTRISRRGQPSYIPTTKAFALSKHSLLLCMDDAPTGVRSSMRPAYFINPLMTVVGENKAGLTNAYSYMNYLTRFYLLAGNDRKVPAIVTYPVTFKINRLFMAYEKNDVFAMSKSGSVLGQKIIEEGKSAQHPFTLFNSSKEDRQYSINFISGSSLDTAIPDRGENERFRVFVDSNNNKTKDDNENQQLLSMSTIMLKAQEDLNLVVVHRPNYQSKAKGGVLKRHNRKFQDGFIRFQEVKRLRSASYAIRTWLGSAEEVNKQETILPTLSYPSENSDYKKYAQYNHLWDNNPGLIRNSPDFNAAMSKKALNDKIRNKR